MNCKKIKEYNKNEKEKEIKGKLAILVNKCHSNNN